MNTATSNTTTTRKNWEIGIMTEGEFKQWNEKIHKEWFELTEEVVPLDKYISELELEEMKKLIKAVHDHVESFTIRTATMRQASTWTQK
ncbi:hypothetical protein QZN08_27165 [Burkholderia multivorans]|uniref:hypothetical protein n=1 Tax=Burkholderia multivorans TaxID=87883 RepID=UPI001C2410ED|nr:hypothetical protein [Burkholderia multivorans]MBU9434133.1 hypothetical protein [Burkholderia multivorans]MDN8018115.1 hypothetical protein [Burkholderia multivorans]